MAREKTKTTKHSVADGPEDISIRFYKSDSAATPPNTIRVEVRIEADGDPQAEIQDFPLAASKLTSPQRAQIKALLVQLRDEAFQRAGYEAKP